MQKKYKIWGLTIFLIVSWIFLFYLLFMFFYNFKSNSLFANLTSFFELSGAFFLILNFTYGNVNKIFMIWKRVAVFCANPSVNWKMATIYNVTELRSDTYERIFNNLNSMFDDFSFPNYYNSNLSNYEMKINQNKYLITIDSMDECFEIRVSVNFRTSYRDSLKDLYSDYEQIEQVIRSSFDRPSNLSYLLVIELEKFNPFYKIYLKHYDKIEKFKFKMSYTNNNANVIISNNKISIEAKKLFDIKNISKNYIAISNDNLFD